MARKEHKVKLLSGSSNPELAQKISAHLRIPLTPVELKRFKDGEIYARILESVRGNTVFVIQSTCSDVNQNLMELLILIDALKRASAGEINAVIPYFGYARQDRKARPREPITGKLVANMLQAAGAHRVVTFDLHAGQSQGFFDIPTDNLEVLPLIAAHFARKRLKDVVVVSPDVGGSMRARALAQVLDASLAIIDKRRPEHGESEIVHVIGDVKGRECVLVDDLIDSGGTIANAADALKRLGARRVFVAATHAVFSEGSLARLARPSIDEIVVTDTIPLRERAPNVAVLSVAPLLAESLRRIYEAEPMGVVFDKAYESLKSPGAKDGRGSFPKKSRRAS